MSIEIEVSYWEKPHQIVLKKLVARMLTALGPHDDNTGAPCKGNITAHDCCFICNFAEDMTKAYAANVDRYFTE